MKRLISLILALLGAAGMAGADIIYVQGDVWGTWAADTVMVTGEVRVPPGQTLVIEPGVKVLFAVYCKFIVERAATLLAVGTQSDSILFAASDDSAHWHGIHFMTASNESGLEYAHLRQGLASGSVPDQYGGAIYMDHCEVTIRWSTIENCSGIRGGAIYLNYCNGIEIVSNNFLSNHTTPAGYNYDGGGSIYGLYSNPVLENNLFVGNYAQSRAGGGVYFMSASSGTIKNNEFTNNSASSGGAVYCIWSNLEIAYNIFVSNSTYESAGAISSHFLPSPYIHHNTFQDNSSANGGAIGSDIVTAGTIFIFANRFIGNSVTGNGGGINFVGTAQIINNLFAGNTANYGGGICLSGVAWGLIQNNTFAGNIAASQGGGIYSYGGQDEPSPVLSCIFWGNTPQQISNASGIAFDVNYCDVQGGYTGVGNIDQDPVFVTGSSGDYYLSQIAAGQTTQSPCVDVGDPFSQTFVGTTRTDGVLDENGMMDMGFHYDAFRDFVIELTPVNPPIQIPPEGGSFSYQLEASNAASTPSTRTIWCDLILPNGTHSTPTFGPINLTLSPGQQFDTLLTQVIRASNPGGVYSCNG